MHLNPVSIGIILSLSVLLIIYLPILYFRHRIRRNRELIYLLGQENFEYILIDIRRVEDYEKEHIPGAFNVPYPESLNYLPSENMFERIYVYGQNRCRTREVVREMSDTGYFNVSYVGIFREWKGPVEKEKE